MRQERITSIRFSHYKAFKELSLSLQQFNILVGPNNSGKSTIIGAFRILAEALRKAQRKNPELVQGPDGQVRGYSIDMKNVPIARENIFYDYDETTPANIKFRISNGNNLILHFPAQGLCNLICECTGKPVISTSTFSKQFPLSIGFVPVLGPVDHDEQLYQPEAARLALLTHRAARNFRNIWYHYPDNFDDFRHLVQETWPGMDIERPEVDTSHEKPLLRMFCPEERIPREIYWAGFGFQVWCQMLTFVINARSASLFLVDEPDIYLHSDLQRQLIAILKNLGPDILMATHSTEMISEADPDEIVLVTKRARSAKRIADPSQLQGVFRTLGSNLNPVLTQLARTRRVLFVEGKDYQILSRFARKYGKTEVANRADYAVISAEGFNSQKVRDFSAGIEATVGLKVLVAAVFDRDYRSAKECEVEVSALKKICRYAHIHERKEIENFLLVPSAILRAIVKRMDDQNTRTGQSMRFEDDVNAMLTAITEEFRSKVLAQLLARRVQMPKSISKGIDHSTDMQQIVDDFDKRWATLSERLCLVPGKEILAVINEKLQKTYGINLSPSLIIESCPREDVPAEMKSILESLESFRLEQLN